MPRRRVVKKRVVRRRRGKGLGDILGNLGGGIGTGLGSGVRNIFSSLFGGRRKKRVVRRRRRGGAGESEAAAPLGTVGKINKILKDSKIISKAADEFGLNPLGLATVAKTLGYGKRKKRVVRRRRGGALFNKINDALNRISRPQSLKAVAALGQALGAGRRKKVMPRRRRRGGLNVSSIARYAPYERYLM